MVNRVLAAFNIISGPRIIDSKGIVVWESDFGVVLSGEDGFMGSSIWFCGVVLIQLTLFSCVSVHTLDQHATVRTDVVGFRCNRN